MGWHLNIEGQNSGPYDDATIVQWIYAGQLTTAWICQEGASDWVALGAHPPFAEALLAMQGQAQPAAPPPQQPAQPAAQPVAPVQQAAPAQQAPPAPEQGGAHFIADPAQGGAPPAPPPAQGGAPPMPPPAQGAALAAPAIDPSQLEKDSVGKLIKRVPLLFTSPSGYWDAVARLRGGFGELLLPTVLILVGLSAVLSLLGSLIALRGFVSAAPGSMIAGLFVTALLQMVASAGVWLLMAVLINAFAGVFEAQKDGDLARKLAFGALTPMWLAGIFGLIPVRILGGLLMLCAFGYGCFLMVVGLPKLNGAAKGKAIGYTAAVMGIMLVIGFVFQLLAACPTGCATACAMKSRINRYRIRRLLRRRLRGAAPPRKLHKDRGQAYMPAAKSKDLRSAKTAHYTPGYARLAAAGAHDARL
jgi:hypothetical protein